MAFIRGPGLPNHWRAGAPKAHSPRAAGQAPRFSCHGKVQKMVSYDGLKMAIIHGSKLRCTMIIDTNTMIKLGDVSYPVVIMAKNGASTGQS